MAKRRTVVKKKVAEKAAVATARTSTRKVRVKGKSGKASARKKGLYFFQDTPRGSNRRAYFIAMIVSQIGGLVPDKPFKLWPGGTFRTHLDTKKLVRGEGKDVYKLSTQGVNFFSAESKRPEKEAFALMMKAVQNGTQPSIHDKELSPMPGMG